MDLDARAPKRAPLVVVAAGLASGLAVAAVGELVSFLILAAKLIPGDSTAAAVKRGLLFVYLFTHDGMEMSTPALHLPHGADKTIGLASGLQLTAYPALALMLGTLLVFVVFFFAGRAVGRSVGGSVRQRAMWGATTALSFAIATCVLAYVVKLHVEVPQTSPFDLHPAHMGAFFWPLILAMLGAFVGGVASAPSEERLAWLELHLLERWIRRWFGAFAGASRMLVLGMVFSFASLVVMAFVKTDATRAYLRGVSGHGVLGVVTVVVLTMLAVPNMATWILIPAMGGCLDVGGGVSLNPPGPYCFLSYGHSISHRLPSLNPDWTFANFHNLGGLPAIYLLFLLVPAAATVLGGVRAVRVARASTVRETLIVSVLTGLVFALMMGVVLVLAWVTVTTIGPDFRSNDYLRYGPYPAYGLQLCAGWGVAGGLLGGLLAIRRVRST